jgi:transcriptional regulator with XRE-family HTH domain
MNTPKEIGDYLKRLRKEKGISQVELAEKIGVKPPTLSQYESGETNMTLSTLNRVADALGYQINVSFSLKR